MTKAAVQRKPLFERLKSALEEGIQFARGTANLRMAVMPAPPPEFHAREIIQLRRRVKLSQRVFARTLNVSTKTVQSWEQGYRRPSPAALRLLQVLAERPELVCAIVGIASQGDTANRQKSRLTQEASSHRARAR
jgi:putative transcriptional regulator